MQREGRTPTPDVDNFDPNIDPAEGPVTQESHDEGAVTGVETPPEGTSADNTEPDPEQEKAQRVVDSYN